MRYFILFFLVGSTCVALAQKTVLSKIPATGSGIMSFVPEGYDTLATTEGDLNKDKLNDIVLVLKAKEEDTGEAGNADIDDLPDRLMVVLFKKGDGYIVAGRTSTSILCKNCGGVFGDPFAGVSITNGVLKIEHYGGSAWRWGSTHKFRFQQNSFYLIGETRISYWNVAMCEELGEFAATDYKDVNFLTGAYEEKKVSQEGCKWLVNKKGKMKMKPLKKLTGFIISN
jgi:hypothetical protein